MDFYRMPDTLRERVRKGHRGDFQMRVLRQPRDGVHRALVPLLEARERAGAAALGLAVWADEGQQNFALGLQLGALAAAHIGLPHELQAPRSWAIASSGREWDPSLF